VKIDFKTNPTFEEIRRELIAQGVDEFEKQIVRYPFVVFPSYPEYEDDPKGCLDYISKAEQWLAENVKRRYLAFPGTAIGKHARCCRNVYFVRERDAVYFKLGCSY
jgi:hypothetical protein